MVSMLSRRRAVAKSGSAAMRDWMRVLKSRVRGISSSFGGRFGAAAFVVGPHGLGGADVGLLALFGAAGEEDDETIAVAGEVDAVAWSPVDAVFEDALADGFELGGVALFEAGDGGGDFGGGLGVEGGEPCFEGAGAVGGDVDEGLWHI